MRNPRPNDLENVFTKRPKRGECPSFDCIHPSWTRIAELDEDLKIVLEKPKQKFPFKTRHWLKDVISERLYNLATAPKMTQTHSLGAKFVHLQKMAEEQSHLLLRNSNMALVGN